MAPLEQVPFRANALAANATVTGSWVEIGQDGYLVLVGFPALTGAGLARVRAIVDLGSPVSGSDGQTRVVVGSMWEGYVRAAGSPPSMPNLPVGKGWAIRVRVAAATGWTTGAVAGSAWVSKDKPTSQPFIWREPVGKASGPGDQATHDLTDPAANTAYTAYTVGAQERARPIGFLGEDVVDIGAGTDQILKFVVTDGADIVVFVSSSTYLTQGGTYNIGGCVGGGVNFSDAAPLNGARSVSLPPDEYPAGYTFRPLVSNTAGVNPEGNLAQGRMLVERWAVI